EARREGRGCLSPQGNPIAARPQPVERRRRLFAHAGRIGQLLLGLLAFGDQACDPLVERAACPSRGLPPRVGFGAPLRETPQIERCDGGPEACDLACELLCASRGGRLEGQRPETFADLVLEIAGALDLHGDPRELQLRAVTAALETAEPGRLLDELAPLLRLR